MKPTDILAATTAFRQALQQDVVPDDVIAQRARICKQCPVRVKSVLAGVVARALEKAPVELKNFACGICRCPLGLLVPAKEPHVDSAKEKARRMKINPNCWMLKL